MICPKCGSKHTYPLSVPMDSGVMYGCNDCRDHWIVKWEELDRMTEQKTNRDVVNAMTDEELAKWKLDLSGSEHVRGKNGFCRIWWQDAKHCSENCKCKDCLTAWLKADAGKHQEVER